MSKALALYSFCVNTFVAAVKTVRPHLNHNVKICFKTIVESSKGVNKLFQKEFEWTRL